MDYAIRAKYQASAYSGQPNWGGLFIVTAGTELMEWYRTHQTSMCLIPFHSLHCRHYYETSLPRPGLCLTDPVIFHPLISMLTQHTGRLLDPLDFHLFGSHGCFSLWPPDLWILPTPFWSVPFKLKCPCAGQCRAEGSSPVKTGFYR
jgi:hypothetical protein